MNISACVDSQFSVVIKDFDEIYHLGRNECLNFIALCKCLSVLEEKSCRGYSFLRDDNFLLKYENCSMKIINFFSVIEYMGGYLILNITIHPYNMSYTRMWESG